MCFIQGLNPYRAVNTLHLSYKTNMLLLHKAIFDLSPEIHSQHINAIREPHRFFLILNLVVPTVIGKL